jgi:hypothetical protein
LMQAGQRSPGGSSKDRPRAVSGSGTHAMIRPSREGDGVARPSPLSAAGDRPPAR